MVKTLNVSKMLIYHANTRTLLGATPGYWLPREDIDQCLDVFVNPEKYLTDNITLFKSIPEVEMKFLVIKADERSWYAKRGATSCFCGRSKEIMILAFAEPPVMPGQTANAVEKLLDYFFEYNM